MSTSYEEIGFLDEEVEVKPSVDWPEHKPDPRLSRTSYSSTVLFHGCPRKYQLQKLSTQTRALDWRTALTFSFGHSVEDAVIDILLGKSYDETLFKLFVTWEEHLYSENDKQKKSFFHALNALDIFVAKREEGFLEEFEVATFNGKPAVQLGLKIKYPNGGSYRGFIDVVLRNTVTGLYTIFDCKTNSGMYLQPNQYKNSEQAIGYSTILDKFDPGFTDYAVHYLTYMTRKEEWIDFEFPKSRTQRVLWIKDRMWDAEILESLVKREGNHGIWPMHGNHCVNFNRECDFLGKCHMDTKMLVSPLTEDMIEEDESVFDFVVNLEELL